MLPGDTFPWSERGRDGFFVIMMKVLTELYYDTSQSSISVGRFKAFSLSEYSKIPKPSTNFAARM